MIDRFIEALNREAEMSAVEIADILWLAVQLQESESDSSDSSDSFDSSDSSDSSVSSPVEEEKDSDNDTEELKQEQEIAPEEKSQTSDSNKITTDQPSKEKKARIYPRHQGQTSKTDLYFKTPNAPSLRSPLTIAQQAFNPLIRRVPGSTSPTLDEVATSQGIADTGLWLPVLRPTLEPWLDLELVVDESISMQIWRQTIIDLKKLLTNYGIFRDVRVWGLIINDREPVQIRRGIGAMAKNRYPRSPKELIDDSGRRLVLVASDCVSPPWRDGKVTEVLQLWAHRLPMAIIQMLPKWLWKRTALGIGTEVRLRGLTPGISNQNLIAEGVSLLSELDEKNGVKVPVFTLEADKAGSWAQMLSGQGSIWTSGVMFELDKTLVNQEDRLFNLDYSKFTAQQRVQTFRVTASPMARKLAGLLAAAPVITLPVVRLIREVLLKDSLQVNMAEVFLGGLLKPVSEVNLETHPDQVLYDFMDGVRELLVDSVPLSYVKDVVDEVSEYVAKKAGLSLESFAAVLRNPQKVWEGEFTDEVRYFATVSPGVLRRLGREFVQVAEELERNLGTDITILYKQSGNQLRQALKSSGYSNIKLESHFLAWQCFKAVFAPVKGEKHNLLTKEQLEAIAALYLILQKRRWTQLKQDNSQVNAEFIHQCLENTIEALYKYNSRPKEISYDAPLKNGEGTTLLDLTPEERYNWEVDATMINFQESDDLLNNLNSKEYGSLILLYVFELSMDAIAQLYKENTSQVSRRINKSNKRWLEEFCQRQGMSEKAEELRAQKKLDPNISQLVNEVRKNNEQHFSSLVYQTFLKIWQQLEPSSKKILELHIKHKHFNKNTPELSLSDAEEEKIEYVFQVLVSQILQWLEEKLEISLASSEPLTKKTSDLVDEFLIHIYQENIYGVAKFGYDLYLLVVAKLLNNKYSRLFNFHFHTLINQRHIY
ncbi:MAG: hypothetical protein MGU50_11855 [Trichodesmium sp. MAG_R02]|nr:hypothetical protein [Trichodesmium sp. MAG_R02]